MKASFDNIVKVEYNRQKKTTIKFICLKTIKDFGEHMNGVVF